MPEVTAPWRSLLGFFSRDFVETYMLNHTMLVHVCMKGLLFFFSFPYVFCSTAQRMQILLHLKQVFSYCLYFFKYDENLLQPGSLNVFSYSGAIWYFLKCGEMLNIKYWCGELWMSKNDWVAKCPFFILSIIFYLRCFS